MQTSFALQHFDYDRVIWDKSADLLTNFIASLCSEGMGIVRIVRRTHVRNCTGSLASKEHQKKNKNKKKTTDHVHQNSELSVGY